MPTDLADAVDRLADLWARGLPTTVAGRRSVSAKAPETEADSAVVVLDRLDRIVDLDRESSVIVAQAGTPIDAVREAARSIGLWCPALRWLPGATQIGAALAGGHGRRSRRYGTVADHVLGTRFACPSVGLVRHGGKAIKNASGFNLSAALAGSRGTLGVILEVTLRLVPLPVHRLTRRFQLAPAETAFELARALADVGLDAAAVEISIDPSSDLGHVLVEVEDSSRGNGARQIARLTDRATELRARVEDSDTWPANPLAGAVTRRLSIDPKHLSAIGQQVLAACRDQTIAGSIVAETTGGAIELSLAGTSSADLAVLLHWRSGSAARPNLDVLRGLLKSAFDPGGLLPGNTDFQYLLP